MSDGVRAVPVSPAMVQQRAVDLVGSEYRVLLLRARPQWVAGDVKVGDQVVPVVPGISQLAILDTYATLGPDDFAVILTDRPSSDLGDAVLARAYKQQVELPDEWETVPRLFEGAREVSRELRRLDWAATALLDHQPVGGWPRSPEVALSATQAIGALLGHVGGLGADADLDGAVLLSALGRRHVRAVWAAVEPSLQRHLIAWQRSSTGHRPPSPCGSPGARSWLPRSRSALRSMCSGPMTGRCPTSSRWPPASVSSASSTAGPCR